MTNANYQIDPILMEQLTYHLTMLKNKYSKLLPIRMDLAYRHSSQYWHQRNNDYSSADIYRTMEQLMMDGDIVGYAWVMEHTEQHGIHFHVALYINAQQQRNYFPVFERATELWQSITANQGIVHDCQRRNANYTVNGLRTFAYHDKSKQDDFLYAISYLAKEEQKELFIGQPSPIGMSYVPEPSGRGRPRTL